LNNIKNRADTTIIGAKIFFEKYQLICRQPRFGGVVFLSHFCSKTLQIWDGTKVEQTGNKPRKTAEFQKLCSGTKGALWNKKSGVRSTFCSTL